jgi:hypothetical protein
MFKRFLKEKPKGERGEELPAYHEGLPDSFHAGGLCPRCGKQSSFQNIGSLPITFDSSYMIDHTGRREPLLLDRVTSLICCHCGHGVAVVEEKWIGDHPVREGMKGGGIENYHGISWWPLPETKLPKDVPQEIASAFAEAATALHANCPRASAVMARRALEAITVDKGETIGPLVKRLRNLATNNILQSNLADWADEVRLVGNMGAHYDVINRVETDDAQQLMKFV